MSELSNLFLILNFICSQTAIFIFRHFLLLPRFLTSESISKPSAGLFLARRTFIFKSFCGFGLLIGDCVASTGGFAAVGLA